MAKIEFFPEEGKYHYDGHSKCKIVFSPNETKKHKNICPVCGKPLIIGVMNRVEKLSDRKISIKSKSNYHTLEDRVPYYNLVQLDEIIAEALGVGPSSKKVKNEYENLIKTFGSELNVLMDVGVDKIKFASNEKIAEGVKIVREGNLKISPGYDGEYGTVKIFNNK
jgi:PHP family Zn ribbon phosphoesterase